jgi:hypothetical protein
MESLLHKLRNTKSVMETVKYFTTKREGKMEPIDTELFGVVHRAKKINSKVKGNRNELEVTKLLSDWTGHEFTRVPMSGGLRWKNRMDICGDVINVDPGFSFPFSVEAKSYKNLGLPVGLGRTLRSNSIIYRFFDQCSSDAKASNKIPLLIVRENQMPKNQHYIFIGLTFDQIMRIENYITPKFYCPQLSGYDSKEFFEKVSLETLKFVYNV